MSNNPFDKYDAPSKYHANATEEEESIGRVDARIKDLARTSGRRHVLRFFIVGSAAVALLFIGRILIFPPDISSAADRFFEPYPNYSTTSTRGETGITKTAYAAYDKGDFANAVYQFEEMANTSVIDSFYLAISLQADERWEKSVPILKTIKKDMPPEFGPAVAWYTALGLLKMEEVSEARVLLQDLTQGSSEFGSKAESLLRAIQ